MFQRRCPPCRPTAQTLKTCSMRRVEDHSPSFLYVGCWRKKKKRRKKTEGREEESQSCPPEEEEEKHMKKKKKFVSQSRQEVEDG